MAYHPMLWSKGSIVDLYYQKDRTDFRNESCDAKTPQVRPREPSHWRDTFGLKLRRRHPLPSWAATVIPPAACIILLKSFFLPRRYNLPVTSPHPNAGGINGSQFST